MKITKEQLKQIIKEELEVILTNEEAADMFGEEILDQLEEGWPKKVKKGRFTAWCKRNGFEEGAGISCAKKAMDSDDESVRGMAAFYMNTVQPKGKDLGDIVE